MQYPEFLSIDAALLHTQQLIQLTQLQLAMYYSFYFLLSFEVDSDCNHTILLRNKIEWDHTTLYFTSEHPM